MNSLVLMLSILSLSLFLAVAEEHSINYEVVRHNVELTKSPSPARIDLLGKLSKTTKFPTQTKSPRKDTTAPPKNTILKATKAPKENTKQPNVTKSPKVNTKPPKKTTKPPTVTKPPKKTTKSPNAIKSPKENTKSPKAIKIIKSPKMETVYPTPTSYATLHPTSSPASKSFPAMSTTTSSGDTVSVLCLGAVTVMVTIFSWIL